jgi:hypothetical protein
MRLEALLAVAALALGCSSRIDIQHDFDPSADFSGYRTFRMMEESRPRPRSQQMYEARLETAISNEMTAKGLRLSNNPDLLVAWDAASEGKKSVSTTGSTYGTGYYGRYGRGWRGGYSTTYAHTTVNEWTEGTLIIDVIDAARERLVFRGSAQAKLNERATPEERTRRLNEAVAMILENLPIGN